MELAEPVEYINKQLIDLFGIDTVTGLPMWKVVFSEDQFEKRLGTYDDYSPAGIFLRTVTEVRLVPKYSQWIHQKYILERLVVVPEINREDLPTSKLSYEPIHVFQTGSGKYLPPKLIAAKFIVDAIYAATGKSSLAKYKDPEAGLNSSDLVEHNNARINGLQTELFGNETFVGDALAHREAVIVPSSYKKVN
jgi:hypothetical protein